MKIIYLILGLCLGSVGTAGFYIYAFDKPEYVDLAPQSLRSQLISGTTTLWEETDDLRQVIADKTGFDLSAIKIAPADDKLASHDEKGHDHGDADHKDDDHGDEKGHDHGDAGHKDDDHGDEKEHGHGDAGHKDDDHGDEKDHGHEEAGHKDHGHGESGHNDGEEVVRLTESQQEEFGVELGYAKPRQLGETIALPGEVKFNGDRVAHIVPRVKGIVSTVSAKEGDYVKAGDVLAVLESRELASIKAEYLAASGRLEIAQANFDREARLRAEKISTEQTYLEAKGALAEAEIVLRTISQQLLALGFNSAYLSQLLREPDTALTSYQLVAPFDGRIISRHITLGETISDSNEAYIMADMSDMWVDFQIFPKDLEKIQRGQSVSVFNENNKIISKSKIAFIAPQIQEETRTGIARIIIPRTDMSLRPGLFVTASVEVGNGDEIVTIPKTAPQTMNEKTVVFITQNEGFEAQEVTLGRTQGEFVEVLSGLDLTTPFVTAGAFVLKAQLSKAQFGDGHNH